MRIHRNVVELWCARARIEGRQRQVLILRLAGGLTLAEVGEELGIEETTAGTHYYRAGEKLRRCAEAKDLLRDFYDQLLNAMRGPKDHAGPPPHFNVTGRDDHGTLKTNWLLGERQPAHGGEVLTVDDLAEPGRWREIEREVEEERQARRRRGKR